jgi:hypothetical protein
MRKRSGGSIHRRWQALDAGRVDLVSSPLGERDLPRDHDIA